MLDFKDHVLSIVYNYQSLQFFDNQTNRTIMWLLNRDLFH